MLPDKVKEPSNSNLVSQSKSTINWHLFWWFQIAIFLLKLYEIWEVVFSIWHCLLLGFHFRQQFLWLAPWTIFSGPATCTFHYSLRQLLRGLSTSDKIRHFSTVLSAIIEEIGIQSNPVLDSSDFMRKGISLPFSNLICF